MTGSASPAGVVRSARPHPTGARSSATCATGRRPGSLVGLPYNMDGTDTALTGPAAPVRRRPRAAFRAAGRTRRRTPVLGGRPTDAARGAAIAARARAASVASDIDAHAARLILETWLRGQRLTPGSRTTLSTDTGRDLQRDRRGTTCATCSPSTACRASELSHLLDRAQFYVRLPGRAARRATEPLRASPSPTCSPSPSTRTRVSFELAAKRLGADVVNLEMQLSSRVKGETVLDTIYTLQAMHVDVFVMRDAEPGVPAYVASHVAAARQRAVRRRGARVAPDPGPARCADDPASTRADFAGLAVAIVGDVRHSRVARSAWHACSRARRRRAPHRRAGDA